jgi:phosphoglycerate dehydrogenase-like enzyme
MNFACIMARGYERQFVRDDLRAAMTEHGAYRHYAWTSDAPPPEAELLAALDAADVLLTGWGTPRLPLSLLSGPRRHLRYICNLTGSIRKWIPREYLEAGITVTNWGDGPMWYLAEGCLALMLACSREMSRVHRHMLERPQWTFPYRSPKPTLRRKTVGFLGFGAIGRLLRDLLAPLECGILVHDPYVADLPEGCLRAASIEDLFARSDLLTVQCGLSPETEGLVTRRLLDLLKPHAIFINTARGKIVIEADLAAFLRDRPDVFAGLDVYEVEPLPKDSPLLRLDNAICYPHSVCGGGEDMHRAASEFAAANIRACCAGRPLRAVVTPAMYDRMT